MMNITVKGIDVAGDFLKDHCPDDLEFFSLWVTITVGSSLEAGGVLYNLHVCTPDWLKVKIKNTTEENSIWGRHLLIVEKFDAKKIELMISNKIQEIVQQYPNDNGVDISEKIARYAQWEFEDYVPY